MASVEASLKRVRKKADAKPAKAKKSKLGEVLHGATDVLKKKDSQASISAAPPTDGLQKKDGQASVAAAPPTDDPKKKEAQVSVTTVLPPAAKNTPTRTVGKEVPREQIVTRKATETIALTTKPAMDTTRVMSFADIKKDTSLKICAAFLEHEADAKKWLEKQTVNPATTRSEGAVVSEKFQLGCQKRQEMALASIICCNIVLGKLRASAATSVQCCPLTARAPCLRSQIRPAKRPRTRRC